MSEHRDEPHNIAVAAVTWRAFRARPSRMPFPSLPFLAFFLVVWPLVWATWRRRHTRNVVLVVASYVFYAGIDWRLAALLGGSSVANWAFGELVFRARRRWCRSGWTGLAIVANVLFLGFFKYATFVLDNVDAIARALALEAHVPVLEILLPIGISFYTFQNIAYVVDLQRGYGVKARSLGDYLLFASFFPQLLIGPICRSRDLLPQIHAAPPKRIPNLSLAVSLIFSGLFKKVVLATYLQTHLVDDVFLAPENYAGVDLLVTAYVYTIQVYCEFSGYTDMARGIGLLLGFHLPENFNQPYRSTSIAEFWRRWHMTFGNWLRDYIYFPLGGGRRAPPRVYLNLMITLVIAGTWHGASWGYVLWGTVHGLALVAYRFTQDVRRRRGADLRAPHPWWWLVVSWLWTFHVVVLARILFRAGDLELAGAFYRGLVMLPVEPLGQGVEVVVLAIVALGLGLNFFGQYVRRAFVAIHEATPWPFQPVWWALLAVAVLLLQPSDVAPFLYFKF